MVQRKSKGVSVIAFLICFVLLVISVLGSLTQQVKFEQATVNTTMRVKALEIAKFELEYFYLYFKNYDEKKQGNEINIENTVLLEGMHFNKKTNIVKNSPVQGVKTIKVTVSWAGLDGNQHSTELESLVYQ